MRLTLCNRRYDTEEIRIIDVSSYLPSLHGLRITKFEITNEDWWAAIEAHGVAKWNNWLRVNLYNIFASTPTTFNPGFKALTYNYTSIPDLSIG